MRARLTPANLRAKAVVDAIRARHVDGWGEPRPMTRQQVRRAVLKAVKRRIAEERKAAVAARRVAHKHRRKEASA